MIQHTSDQKNSESFGIYVHIPFCKQLCLYCDFSRYLISKNFSIETYIELVLKEIELHSKFVQNKTYTSLYFGGGTPSIIPPKFILAIIQKLASCGFHPAPHSQQNKTEMCIEIDPATLDETQLNEYIEMGFNRFSVGVQTFHDAHLKRIGRKHSSQDSHKLLKLLHKKNLNYSFDLLFALPNQSIEDLKADLDQILEYRPPHLSAYGMNLEQNNPLFKDQPPDELQAEMFQLITEKLESVGIYAYEISNYAQTGFESQHNCTYWSDQSYWGIGVSSHSYLKNASANGTRFANPKRLSDYKKGIEEEVLLVQNHENYELKEVLKLGEFEELKLSESITDFCHTFLRRDRGLSLNDLNQKFSSQIVELVIERLQKLQKNNLLVCDKEFWKIPPKSRVLANLIFQELTFTDSELKH